MSCACSNLNLVTGGRVYRYRRRIEKTAMKFENLSDVKKAFRFLKKNREAAICIDNISLFWDSVQNYEHGTLTCRTYTPGTLNYKECIWSFEGCKQHFYAVYKNK